MKYIKENKVLIAFLVIVTVAAFLLGQSFKTPDLPAIGYGGIRQPTVLLPPSMTMTRTYDAETDLVCMTFKTRVSASYYLQSTDCVPRRDTDY